MIHIREGVPICIINIDGHDKMMAYIERLSKKGKWKGRTKDPNGCIIPLRYDEFSGLIYSDYGYVLLIVKPPPPKSIFARWASRVYEWFAHEDNVKNTSPTCIKSRKPIRIPTSYVA